MATHGFRLALALVLTAGGVGCSTTRMAVKSPDLVELRYDMATADGNASSGTLLAAGQQQVLVSSAGEAGRVCQSLPSATHPKEVEFRRTGGALTDLRGAGQEAEIISAEGRINLALVHYQYELDERAVRKWKASGVTTLPYNTLWPALSDSVPVVVDAVVHLEMATPLTNVKYVAVDTDYAELVGFTLYGIAVLPFLCGMIECLDDECGPLFYYSAPVMLGSAGLLWFSSESDAMVGTSYLYDNRD